MYRAVLTGNTVSVPITFFNDQNTGNNGNILLSQAKISQKIGKAGTFTFTMPPTNPYIDSFEKLVSYVDVYRDDDLIFSGRVYDQKKDIHSMVTIVCEGLLSVFNDSVMAPNTYEIGLVELLQAMLDVHNSQVGEDKQVQLGNVTVNDEYVYRAYEDYMKTIDRLMNLADDYNAYLNLRKTEDGLYLDFLQSWDKQASQTIDFGENLLALDQKSMSDDIITVIVPIGAEYEDEDGNKHRTTIESVNDGKNYIENTNAIAEFGRIYGIVNWDDVTVPANLYAKAEAYLSDMSRSRVEITVSAIDMARAGSSIEAWKLGDNVIVNAEPLGIVRQSMTISEYTLDLLNPVNNKMRMGEEIAGYISKTLRRENEVVEKVERIIEQYNVNQQLQELLDMANNNSDNITNISELVAVLQSEIVQSSESIQLSITEQLQSLEDDLTQTLTTSIMELTANQWKVLFDSTNLASWLTFDSNGNLIIGRSDSPIQSRQTNESYEFYDTASGTVILRMDTTGVTGPSMNVSEQLRFTVGNLSQWVIRRGKTYGTVGYNLNDVWIGGGSI